MHRAAVAKRTRRAQALGGVLVLGALGLSVAPGTWAVGRGALEPIDVPRPPERPPPPDPVEVPDGALLALALNGASPAMPREAPPPVAGETAPEPGETPAPPPPPPPVWTYVGAVIGPGVRRAIVSVDDKQRFASVGESVRDDEIVEVQPDRLIVRRAGVEREVPLAEKVERPVSASVGGPVHAGGVPAVPGVNPAGINPATRPAVGGAGGAAGRSNPTAPGVKRGAVVPPQAVPPRTANGNQAARLTPQELAAQRAKRDRDLEARRAGGSGRPAEEGDDQ